MISDVNFILIGLFDPFISLLNSVIILIFNKESNHNYEFWIMNCELQYIIMNYEFWILNYYDEQLSHSSTSNDLLRT